MSYSSEVLSDAPIGYWRLGEASGSATVSDSSGVGRTGTLQGAATLGNPGALSTDPTATSLGLNGTSGTYVSVASASGLPTTGPCTIEGWIKIRGVSSSGFHSLLAYGAATTNHMNGLLVRGTTDPYINWWANDNWVTLASMTGTWHHLAYTYDGTQRLLYMDGVLIAQQRMSGLNATSASLALGARIFHSDLYANAYLQELALYTTALSPTRIAAHYTAGGGVIVARTALCTLVSTGGQGTTFVLGTEPTGWTLPGFDDSLWHTSQLASSTWPALIEQSQWVTDPTIQGNQPTGLEWLHRNTFTLSMVRVLSATLQIFADNQMEDCYINGTHVYSGPLQDASQSVVPAPITVDPSVFIKGGTNVLAVKSRNSPDLSFPTSGPTSLDYRLLITGSTYRRPFRQIHVPT